MDPNEHSPARTGTRPAIALLAAAFALAAVAIGFGAATAGAAIFRPGAGGDGDRLATRKGVFRVSVEGVQTNRWSEDKAPLHECDVASKGSGFERIRFKAPARRMRISAFGTKRADSAVFDPLPARATVTRKGKRDQTPATALPSHCLADGGGGPPPPPKPVDCGTKRSSLKLSLFALEGELSLDRTSGGRTPPKLFENCTWTGTVWPGLLTMSGNGGKITTEFSPRWVFNPRFNRRTGAWSKVIMIGRGTRKGRSFGTTYTSSIRWTVTMKRLR